jgi:hypothetical protein
VDWIFPGQQIAKWQDLILPDGKHRSRTGSTASNCLDGRKRLARALR